jgi:hypothetical protein
MGVDVLGLESMFAFCFFYQVASEMPFASASHATLVDFARYSSSAGIEMTCSPCLQP